MQAEFGIKWKFFAIAILLGWYGFFVIQQIDLTTADLGRHLKNGEIIYENLFSKELAPNESPLVINFYSYTNQNHPTVNHHWGSGLIFYFISILFGMDGLSVFYVLTAMAALLLFFDVARKEGGYSLAFPIAILLIPMIGERAEVRPEVFSYLFSGIFLWILWNYHRHRLSDYWLLALPVVQVLWVNTHIYFFFGPALSALILAESLIFCRREAHKIKWLALTLLAVLAATFINPFGYKALTYTLTIFNDYGYRLVENQSVGFLINYGLENPNLILYFIVTAILAVSFSFAFYNRKFSHNPVCASCSLFMGVLGFGLAIFAFLAIRNFAIYGLFALPVISYAIYNSLPRKHAEDPELIFLMMFSSVILITSVIFYNHPERLLATAVRSGIGILPGNDASAEFFLTNKLAGPVFNNYDIGSYLIYRLYPEKVFVDNRPEAYPQEFFEKIYVPMQENYENWKVADSLYNFNAIFFSHRDATPWGQKFLIDRVQDPEWAPVFADNFAIIFLKRSSLNSGTISRYEIAKSNFSIIQN